MVLLAAATAVATAGLLAWTGSVKLLGRTSADGLTALLRSARYARAAMRVLGAVEVGVAAALLVAPWPGGVAASVLGVGFLGYLVTVGRVAPGTSCGCAGPAAPVSWRTYGRASAVVVAGGVVAWYGALLAPVVAASPREFAGSAVLCVVGYVVLSPELDRWWLRPLRRVRLRLVGHPLAVAGASVPVAASVELLETSLAWQATAHLVKSSLLEHWATGDWRVLRYAGRDGTRPVTVLFAVDARATTGSPREVQVRVTVIDDQTGDVLAEPPLRMPKIRPLPVA